MGVQQVYITCDCTWCTNNKDGHCKYKYTMFKVKDIDGYPMKVCSNWVKPNMI